MYELLVEDYFSAAHSLKYLGRCENMHGHNWKVQVFVESETLSEIGLVIDFKEIKKSIQELFEIVDHTNLNESLKGLNPTSENISMWFYKKLAKSTNLKGINIKKVRVWESIDSAAAYYE